MLSFDFSDRTVNIVKGDNSGPKIKIERSLTVDVPQDMVVSGEVINILGLRDILLEALKGSQMMDKEAVVTFSSSSVVFKELVVPKAKSNEFLNMVQNQMSQEMGISDDYSISYTIVGEAGEKNPGSQKVLATACPTNLVESYRNLFKEMQIQLTSVNISCNSISRIVLADKTNKQRMPLLVCQIDDNFLGLILFENNQMAFARYEPISAEDYESEEYLTEAISENIFRMEQFNKARGGTGLNSVVLYGKIDDFRKLVDALDSLDVKASVLGVPNEITGYENFEFTVFANAIGALYKRNKTTERINLLEINTSTGKVKEDNSGVLTTMLISVGVSVALIAGVTGVFKWKENKLNEEIAKVDAEIAICDEEIAKNQRLHDYLAVINQYQKELDNASYNLATAPAIKTEVFEKIEENLKETDESKKEITFQSLDYNRESGTINISSIQLPEQQTANDFIKTIFEQDYFADASYNGYNGTDKTGVLIDSVSLRMKSVPLKTAEDEAATAEAEVTE